jgi:hypothetical protein
MSYWAPSVPRLSAIALQKIPAHIKSVELVGPCESALPLIALKRLLRSETRYVVIIKTRRTRPQCLTLGFDSFSHVEGRRRLTNRVTDLSGRVGMWIVSHHEIAAHRVARRLRQYSCPFSKVPK